MPTTTEAQPVVIVRYIKASLEVSLPLPPLVRRPPGIGLSHLMPVWLLFALHLLVLLLLQVFVQVFVVAVKNGLSITSDEGKDSPSRANAFCPASSLSRRAWTTLWREKNETALCRFTTELSTMLSIDGNGFLSARDRTESR